MKRLLRLTGDSHERLKVVETEGDTIAPGAGSILEWPQKGCWKNGPFSLTLCQIMALMFPHRSVVAGRLDELWVALFFPPLWIFKISLSREEETAQFTQER